MKIKEFLSLEIVKDFKAKMDKITGDEKFSIPPDISLFSENFINVKREHS